MIETDEVNRRSLPYVVKFNGGYTALITMVGRHPMCLKCRNVGHIRRNCPGVSARRTYANAASGKSNDPVSIFTAGKQADTVLVSKATAGRTLVLTMAEVTAWFLQVTLTGILGTVVPTA